MQKEGEVLVISFQRMSQRRNRGKGKDHLSNVIKYEQSEPTPQSCDFLFDEIHPENSFTSPMSIRILSTMVIAFLDIMMLIGQFIVLFGNVLNNRFMIISSKFNVMKAGCL